MPTFSEQIDRLVTLGYPALAGTSEPAFRELLEPLRAEAESRDGEEVSPARIPYVVVVTRDLVSPYAAVPLLRLPATPDRPGIVDRNHAPGDLATYEPIEPSRPPGRVYLLLDIERGDEFRNVPPESATATVLGRGRSPLTIDEGIALATQVPQVLEKNHCFMLAGSRRADRRVPALWISERAPKLGWCWDGNPHTWLGLASAGGRVAA